VGVGTTFTVELPVAESTRACTYNPVCASPEDDAAIARYGLVAGASSFFLGAPPSGLRLCGGYAAPATPRRRACLSCAGAPAAAAGANAVETGRA